MPARNALIALAAVVSALPMAACSSSGSPHTSSGPTPTSAAGNRTYTEVAARDGQRKTFAVTQGTAHSTRTQTVTDVRRHGDDTIATVVNQHSGAAPRTLTYTVHPDGSLQDPAVPIRLRTGSTLTLDGPRIPAPSVLESGRTTTEHLQARVSRGSETATGTETVTVRGRGFTTVKVPAGTFRALTVAITLTVVLGRTTLAVDLLDQVSQSDGTVAETERVSVNGTVEGSPISEVLTKLVRGATASA